MRKKRHSPKNPPTVDRGDAKTARPFFSAGFTIIELLVTLAIIGMLTSIVMTSLTESRAKSRDAARVSDIKQLQNALQLYYQDNKVYPPTLDSATLTSLYIRAVPRDPLTGASYSYAALMVGSRCSDYHLGATLETVSAGVGVLANDFDSTSAGTVCAGSAANFSGADPVFDVRP